MSALLEIKHAAKRFGGLQALNGVSLEVGEGEIRGLIGPNASGKTTLINCIAGTHRLDRGAITFGGQRIDALQPNEIAATGIMRTFQIAKVFRDMTVLENVIIPGLADGQGLADAGRRGEELLEFALLSHLKHEPARNLSGGQAMLLQIIRGFMHRRLRLYLMDEPFAGVHDVIKGVILKTIHTMNQQKRITFLIVSHEMTTVKSICGQVTVLDKGEVISQGTLEEVANDPVVIDSYLGGQDNADASSGADHLGLR
jgi:branched-chain amino acid transport system ATP-binding protein